MDLRVRLHAESQEQVMWIGEAAEQAGVNVQTFRYYERRGLLPKPPRRTSGYREFPDDAVRIVRFIKRAQDLGFSLDDVEELLRLRRHSGRNRVRIRSLAERRIEHIEQKIAELERMRAALETLVHSCHAGTTLECPIIEALSEVPRD
jgi:Hg(II)-responsive transcriptional regulator